MHNQFPEDSEQLLLPMYPEHFQQELQGYGTVGHYVGELIKSYVPAGQESAASLRKLVPFVVSSESIERPGVRTLRGELFFIGGLLGLRVMELERGRPFMKGLFGAHDYLPVPDISQIKDRTEKMRLVSLVMMNVSDAGYREAEPYHATIEHISRKICTTVDQEPFVRRGFGLTMYMARQVIERNLKLDAVADLGLMRFEAERAPTGDWDAAWAKLQEGDN